MEGLPSPSAGPCKELFHYLFEPSSSLKEMRGKHFFLLIPVVIPLPAEVALEGSALRVICLTNQELTVYVLRVITL